MQTIKHKIHKSTTNITQEPRQIDSNKIKFFSTQADNKSVKLTEWEKQGIKEAEDSLAKGHEISFCEVKKWMQSWFTKNELQAPICK